MEAEGEGGYDPAQTESFENTTLLGMIIDDLIREVGEKNPRYGRILNLIKQEATKGEILDVLLAEYGIKKTQGYSEIKAAQRWRRISTTPINTGTTQRSSDTGSFPVPLLCCVPLYSIFIS